MCLRQLLLDLTVVVNLSFLRVDEQDLSRLQASLADHVARFEVHHTYLTGHHHHALSGDSIAAGAKAVPVEHSAGIAPVRKQQGSRTVPRLHQDRVVFVEGLQVLRDRVLVIETLRNEYRHRLWQRQAAHHQELEHVVEAGRITHALLHNRPQVLDISQGLA